MFIDRFIGGPLDGHTAEVTVKTVEGDPVRHRDTGIEYVRAPHLDTEDTRAWTVDDAPAGQQGDVYLESKTGATLADLRAFVAQADREGWPDDTMPRAIAGWRMRLHKLELSERFARRGDQ